MSKMQNSILAQRESIEGINMNGFNYICLRSFCKEYRYSATTDLLGIPNLFEASEITFSSYLQALKSNPARHNFMSCTDPTPHHAHLPPRLFPNSLERSCAG
jgi:hypothetical protein